MSSSRRQYFNRIEIDTSEKTIIGLATPKQLSHPTAPTLVGAIDCLDILFYRYTQGIHANIPELLFRWFRRDRMGFRIYVWTKAATIRQ